MKTLTNLFIRSLFLMAVTFAQWSSDPASPQLLGSGVQAQVKSTSDGGVYVAWLTEMGGYHVYLQRYDATGVAQFDDGGMLVSDHNNDSWIAVFHMNLAVDNDNNAIITVLDTRAGPWNVYAYKIAPDGSMLWGDDGVSVSNSSQTNYSPRLAVLTDNSAVVAWSPNSITIKIQRISSDGVLMWGDGILIEDNIESLMSPQPIINSNGDVLVQWIGQSGPIWAADSKIYLQKYNLDGNAHWDNPTVAVGPVVFPMGNWSQGIIADDSGGTFSAWTQFSGNVQNAVSQHITEEGTIAWTDGVDLSTNSSNLRMSPMLSVAEETQELMSVWKEANGSQSERGIFAQRLDSSGNQLWGSNGVTVVALNSSYDYLDLSVAAFGEELISTYIQQSTNMNGDIYANRLDAEGNSTWTDETVTVTNTGTIKSDMMAEKGPNCLFIAWTESGSVYAHCLREDGTLGAPDVSSSGCTADDGTEGVEFWGECFSIENTTELGWPPFVPDTATTFPEELFSLVNLTTLSINYSNISESIPQEIGNLINLTRLNLSHNQISGDIPSEIGNLTNLVAFNLSSNQLSGTIPVELYQLLNLKGEMEVLSGPGGGASIFHIGLNLSNNMLSGSIQEEISNFNNLKSLDLSFNDLSGDLPAGLYTLDSLQTLNLSNNLLTGQISHEIGNLLNLEGVTTYAHNSMTQYDALNLSDNLFTGIIPESICDLPLDWDDSYMDEYQGFSISNNQFCDPFPLCVQSFTGNQDTSNCSPLTPSIEGRWIVEYFGNTMYEFDGQNRLTYYCNTVCDSTYWSSLDTSDALPTTNPYTFINDTLTIDLHFGNSFVERVNFLCDGNVIDFNNQQSNLFRIGTDFDECEDYNGQQLGLSTANNSPKKFKLNQNYPNPFNPITTLKYDLPEDSFVHIKIYDMLGNVVNNLVNKNQNSGSKSVQWDATNNQGEPVSAGVYLYKIQAGEFSQAKKMILLK